MFVINKGMGYNITDDDIKCLQPSDVIRALQNEGLPTNIVEKANSFTMQHGPNPNTGYFLITQKDYKKLKEVPDWQYAVHSVTIYSEDRFGLGIDRTTYSNLTITAAVNVLGKFIDDSDQSLQELLENTVIMLKMEDLRYWMKRSYIYNFAYNILSSNKDFISVNPLKYVKPNTTLGGTLYNLLDIFKDILVKFNQQNTHSSFQFGDNISGGDTSLLQSIILYNLEFPDSTILDIICKICESVKLSFTIGPGGGLYIISTAIDDWPLTEYAICNTDEKGPPTVPSQIMGVAQRHSYQLDDDRCNKNHPPNVHRYFHTISSYEGVLGSTEVTTAPYLIQSDFLNNTTLVNDTLKGICERYALIRKTYYRVSHWKGYWQLDQHMAFGLDKIIYSNTGYGFITTCIGESLFDNFVLNYVNPPFVNYLPNPMGAWLYRFNLIEYEDEGGWSSNGANANIYTFDGRNTGYTAPVFDPFGLFADLEVDDWGWCIKVCSKYYAIQAACGPQEYTPTTSPDTGDSYYECWDGSISVGPDNCPLEPFP